MREKLATVPLKPGVYIFRDRDNRVLYVGKARQLRNRLRSYFQKSSDPDARKTAMVREAVDFEVMVTGNELEALILEANLIKQFKPRYNVLLRDDKSYPYIKLTLNERWPRIEVVRRVARDGARYFGPYVPAGNMWKVLSYIRNNYQVRTCRHPLDKPMRPCIQHQIQKCAAPCSGELDHDEYMRAVNEVKLLLEGKNRLLIRSLEKQMLKLSDEMKYEEAALVRDRLHAVVKISESQKIVAPELGDVDVIGLYRKGLLVIVKILFIRNGAMIGSRHFSLKDVSESADQYLLGNFISQFYSRELVLPAEILCQTLPEDREMLSEWLSSRKGRKVKILSPVRGTRSDLVKMAVENAELIAGTEKNHVSGAAADAIRELLELQTAPEEIGAMDISNISGKEAVGAFVRWASGRFVKSGYRRIKMDAIQGPDDYEMMREMVRRIVKNLGEGLPDLLIIDGGKAHLKAALDTLMDIGAAGKDVIAVAKDPDRAFLPGIDTPVALDDGGPAALLLRRIRDEAHRFAVSYHKKLRAARTFESPLEKVPGIAKKRRFELLRHFGSIEAIRNSTIEELAKVKGMNVLVAAKLLEALNPDSRKT